MVSLVISRWVLDTLDILVVVDERNRCTQCTRWKTSSKSYEAPNSIIWAPSHVSSINFSLWSKNEHRLPSYSQAPLPRFKHVLTWVSSTETSLSRCVPFEMMLFSLLIYIVRPGSVQMRRRNFNSWSTPSFPSFCISSSISCLWDSNLLIPLLSSCLICWYICKHLCV